MTPGGFAWLVCHELRLALRGTGRRRWIARAVPLLLIAAFPVVGGVALALLIAHLEPGHRHGFGYATPLGWFGAAGLAVVLAMLPFAAMRVQQTFHDRGDLDLLLGAPIPPSRVLAAKAVGVALGVAAPFLVLIAPFGIARGVLGHPRWLATVAMVGVDAVLATALAMLAVGAMIGAVGPRPARVVVQLGGALLGGTLFLASQAPNIAPGLARHVVEVAARPWPMPLDWPARATRGEPVPFAAMIAVAAGAAWFAAHTAARSFVDARDGDRHRGRARTTVVRFRGGLTRVIVAKELRLIARDPELIMQVALRLIYLIPAAALLARGQHGDVAPAIAAAATGFAGLLSASLAWIVVAAEDAPDLLAAAPRRAADVARAKLIAATLIPVALLAAVAATVAVSGAVGAGVAALGVGTVAAVTAALVQAWFGTPAPRSAFRRRQQASFVVGIGELVLAGGWAACANLAARGSPWALAPALLAAAIMAGAIEAHKSG